MLSTLFQDLPAANRLRTSRTLTILGIPRACNPTERVAKARERVSARENSHYEDTPSTRSYESEHVVQNVSTNCMELTALYYCEPSLLLPQNPCYQHHRDLVVTISLLPPILQPSHPGLPHFGPL